MIRAACVFLLGISLSAFALQLTPRECHALAGFVYETATQRAAGIDKDEHWRRVATENASVPEEELLMLKRAFEAVYASGLTPRKMAEETVQRCYRLKGNMGEDS